MVLLLNYSHLIIGLLFVAYLMFCFKRYKDVKTFVKRALIGGAVALLLLWSIGPLTASYLPKGTTALSEIPNPEFEVKDAVVQDRLRAPARTGDEAAARLEEKLDWRKHKAERAEKKAEPAPATQP